MRNGRRTGSPVTGSSPDAARVAAGESVELHCGGLIAAVPSTGVHGLRNVKYAGGETMYQTLLRMRDQFGGRG